MSSAPRIPLAVSIAISIAIAAAPSAYAQRANAKQAEELAVKQRLEKLTADIKPTLPREVLQGVRLNSFTAGPGRLVTYDYTLLKRATGARVSKLEEAKESGVIDAYCMNKLPASMFSDDVRMHHRYKAMDGKVIYEFSVTPASCKPRK